MRPYATTAILAIILLVSLLLLSLLSGQFYFVPKSKMADSSNLPSYPIDVYKRLHIIPNPDGTITRLKEFFPTVPPSSNSFSLSKDVQLNPLNNTFIRLFLPRQAVNVSDPPAKKQLPIIVFAHGGGFVYCSAATPVFHDFCSESASQIGALVVSLDYRLAPEHRLPAAYDDVLEALTWIRDTKEEWVRKYGDISKCVLMGQSSGGNIVYHAGLRAVARVNDFKPLIIRGLVLIQPYFGGSVRTTSELRYIDDSVVPLIGNDLLWELALPLGANRSHEYCDPTVGGGSKLIDLVRDLGWRVGMIASEGDPLFDRDVELARLLERRGLSVKCLFSRDGQHGVFIADSSNKRKDLLHFVMDILRDL